MTNTQTLINSAKQANGNADDLMRDMLLQLEELNAGGTGYADSLANALADTYASDAKALGVDDEIGITDALAEVTGRNSAAQALDALSVEDVDVKLASAALVEAISKRMLWLAAK